MSPVYYRGQEMTGERASAETLTACQTFSCAGDMPLRPRAAALAHGVSKVNGPKVAKFLDR